MQLNIMLHRDDCSLLDDCQLICMYHVVILYSVKCYRGGRKIPLIYTNMVSLYSVYQAPSYEPNLTFLATFSTELAYLSMLFILDVLCTAGSAEHIKNK